MTMPPPLAPERNTTAVVVLMTIVALVPVGAVVGFLVAARTQGDSLTYALVGALAGVVVALYSSKA
jgi:hypothetical protein